MVKDLKLCILTAASGRAPSVASISAHIRVMPAKLVDQVYLFQDKTLLDPNCDTTRLSISASGRDPQEQP
jgi:hypothetical protein